MNQPIELLVAAVTGAVLGIVTGYALGHEGLGIYLSGHSLAQSLLAGRSIVIGFFVSACPATMSALELDARLPGMRNGSHACGTAATSQRCCWGSV